MSYGELRRHLYDIGTILLFVHDPSLVQEIVSRIQAIGDAVCAETGYAPEHANQLIDSAIIGETAFGLYSALSDRIYSNIDYKNQPHPFVRNHH